MIQHDPYQGTPITNTTSDGPQPLWDPKHAGLGFVIIALFVLFLDILPRLIRTQLDKRTDLSQQEIPDIEELLTPKGQS